ncbi:MAG: hypothetical protein KDC03_22100, partial [Flavobacteriales bacterium]|nr:hypothetical protein [Flavobacteriales bacterium]
DAEGRVVFPFPGERGSGHWEVRSGGDHLRAGTRYFWQRNEPEEQERTRTFLFTDRAIYRPGQPVHFKGLVVRGKRAEHEVIKDLATTIALHDAHGEVVAELSVTTDGFGTFHGSFTAPSGTLTGVMRLVEEHGSQVVRVEEIKRPTFEVVFDPVSGSPVLGEDVEVSGAATSYAGVPLDGASVQWRVLREPRMPWWCGTYWRSVIPWGTSTEIAQGSAGCDASGHFSLSFPALADPAIPRAADPLFHYRVEASVTDLNGETQSGSTGLVVGQRRFTIDLELGEGLSRPEADSLRVRVRKLNGAALDLPASVTIERVVSPGGKLLRERSWERPDGFVLERGEHARLFPDDPYDNEADPLTWPAEATVLDRTDVRGPLALDDITSWRVGTYRITVSAQDSSGAEMSVGRTFALYDPEIQWTGFDAEAMHVEPVKAQVEPGGKAVLLLSTGLDQASVLMEVERSGAIAVRRRFALRQGQQRIELPVQEGDRGGFTVHFLCVERGRVHRRSVPVTVPWSN